jgi:hypothetical protein
MPYCVDTSAWLDGWQRHYPRDVFPSLWAKLDEVIDAGEIICSEEVYIELERKADDLHDWVKDRKVMLVPLTARIQETAIALLSDYPRLVDTLRGRSKADPFVIATAIERQGSIVVTGEYATGRLDKPRIPDVCEAKGIACISFLQMIRDLKLSF